MLHSIIDFIVNTVSNWWYIWIFIMMTIESSFFPFPSEVAMIPAWYLINAWQMNFFLVFFFWTFWAIFWATINYVLWYYFWTKIIKAIIHKYGKYIFLSEQHYILSEKYFKKHWSITTFIWRFIPAIRQLISIPAWIFKMNFFKFLLYTWCWAWIWNLILIFIWYFAWKNQELISSYSNISLITVFVFIFIIIIIYKYINKKVSSKL